MDSITILHKSINDHSVNKTYAYNYPFYSNFAKGHFSKENEVAPYWTNNSETTTRTCEHITESGYPSMVNSVINTESIHNISKLQTENLLPITRILCPWIPTSYPEPIHQISRQEINGEMISNTNNQQPVISTRYRTLSGGSMECRNSSNISSIGTITSSYWGLEDLENITLIPLNCKIDEIIQYELSVDGVLDFT